MSQAIKRCGAEHLVGRERIPPFRKIKIASNLDFPEWREAFPGNKMIGAATLDRLRHGAHKIVLDGESYRGLKLGVESLKNRAWKRRQNQATLIPV